MLVRLKEKRLNTVALIRGRIDVTADRCVVGPLESADAQAEMRASDIIVHLAGTLRPMGGNSYLAANFLTTEAVARAVRAGKATRILYLSYVSASKKAKIVHLRVKVTSVRIL